MKKYKPYYKRNLPHIQPKDGVFAITICLNGMLPKSRIQEIKDARELKISEIKSLQLPPEEGKIAIQKAHQIYFGKYDGLLENKMKSPVWLKQTKIAAIVAEGLHHRDEKDFKLVCYCIMSNHIHFVVYQCQKELSSILEIYKSYTSQEANKILYGIAKKGESRPSFWQHESYDHLIRDRQDFYFQIQYVMNNPVKAGLVEHYSSWKWSYLRDEFEYILR